MNQHVDPRSMGFNYNAEWTGKKPRYYHDAVKLAYLLSQQAAKLDEQAWEMEMAIKDVRTSSAGDERRDALTELRRVLGQHLPPDIDE